MNSHRQVVWDLYNARSSGDPEHLDMAERQLHEHIEAGEAHKLFSIGCDGEAQAEDERELRAAYPGDGRG